MNATIKSITDSNLIEDLLHDDEFQIDELVKKHVSMILEHMNSMSFLLHEIAECEGYKATMESLMNKEKEVANFGYLRAEQMVNFNYEEFYFKTKDKNTISG